MTGSTTTALVWDEAADPAARGAALAFERAWLASSPGRRPRPDDYLPDSVARPGDLLALLRVDLAQRRKFGEDSNPGGYRARFPDLPPDAFIALLYEEYCLREEAGEEPDPREYQARYPEVASRLGEILDIHRLVAEPGSTSNDLGFPGPAFPEVGETIAGFQLVEELGRGSFARVFLARERQLADRLVALKVARTGSREPQTLARLQHTHIVPVHSYRTDPATGLHLLCMPYFGRVTLGKLLAEGVSPSQASGMALVEALDRLGGVDSSGRGITQARQALASRSFPRAIAWWGARLAEGLQHAHDRGVLHRDVKPSNVLIAADGMPMLLDFNLARDRLAGPLAPASLGGTLAYMAPEHLQALTEGHDDGIDHRADVYSLGMVLLESLGSRPMEPIATAPSQAESLAWLIDRRRREPPCPEAAPRPIPASLASVIRRCLAPDPASRYQSAGDLARDLQAVADDAPLAFAREPLPPRLARWTRRNRAGLAIAMTLGALGLTLLLVLFRAQADSIRHEGEARALILDGRHSADRGESLAAAAQFAAALDRLGDGRGLSALCEEAERGRVSAEKSHGLRLLSTTFFERAEPLRFALLGFGGDRAEASMSLVEALKPLGVLDPGDWRARLDLAALDPGRRARLVREVDDLLFYWVIASAMDGLTSDETRAVAVAYCDLALGFTDQAASWRALRSRWSPGGSGASKNSEEPARETSASWCFRRYLIEKLDVERGSSLGWLERATALEPSEYWHQAALGFERSRAGAFSSALAPCEAAVALRPDSPRPREARARVLAALGRWLEAIADLDAAARLAKTADDLARVLAGRGLIRQRIGDVLQARADAEAAVKADPTGRAGRDARRNLARLDADSGLIHSALGRYDKLVATDPGDTLARRGRARLLLRSGWAHEADLEFTKLLADSRGPARASLLAERANARLAANEPAKARADALAAFEAEPIAAHARLFDRARLALGEARETWPDCPDAFDAWPDGGQALANDLTAAAARVEPGEHRTRSVLLSAARDHAGALAEFDRIVRSPDHQAGDLLLRARINRRAGRFEAALADLEAILRDAPENPRAIELRGQIRVDQGDDEAGILDLGVARARGLGSSSGHESLTALLRLGRPDEAIEVASAILAADPMDAASHLGLASGFAQRGEWERSFASLEDAAAVVDDRSAFLGRVAAAYFRALPSRPDRWPRCLGLIRRLALGTFDAG
jgi:serine/threonine protein kinase/predicted Zn-dependent protease